MKGDGELPAASEIAAAAGLAKSTVYIYFRTKGAIFAAILLDGWGAVFEQLERAFCATSILEPPWGMPRRSSQALRLFPSWTSLIRRPNGLPSS
jgi:AcrR family transcriptional regulator